LLKKIDCDGDGSVSEDEFAQRLKLSDYMSQMKEIGPRTLVSKHKFVQVVFETWNLHKQDLYLELISTFKAFDDNGDGVLQFTEFENLMRTLEEKLNTKQIA